MKSRVKKTAVQKYEELGNTLSNKTLVNELIAKYQSDTKNAVQNILNMCKTVKLLNDKVKSNELTEIDLNYFCATVCLDKKSSTFRKYLCIADKADLFEKYLDKVPASYTILYEITTLDADQFELLLKSKQLNNFITLNEVKKITGKIQNVQPKNTSEIILSVKFDTKSVSKESLKVIAECYEYLRLLNDIEVAIPDATVLQSALTKKAA
jgi:hypothetical protein